ncbi:MULTISPECIES: hypothetical protein [Bacillus cereus group]|uniref:hypothetical protein n=1 Tax=Bacillus cereus group TaxID=86661 RepID=UPI000BF1A851|nr:MULTISPECIES: hypothetical protein [Bacillus cereus group]PEO28688.1 hypothetical protein CN589_14045 [Bacillus toyonensis]PFY01396.1 hypothetical protein COL45_17700 [Bacillus toyonensis]PGM06390.1 hypothetical protein CN938_23320 [Bacillus thuringiensis]PHB83479.1 hypothetical protein COE93_04190 [Bacillus toyonensis]
MTKQGLMPHDMIAYPDLPITFQFDFYDNNIRQTWYKFLSHDIGSIPTSKPSQVLKSTIIQGPQSINDIPMREGNAVLMTVSQAPSTWALETYRVRLMLGQFQVFEWDVTFEVGIFPFKIDGTWTQG